jgi:hypothetical protein
MDVYKSNRSKIQAMDINFFRKKERKTTAGRIGTKIFR